MTINGTDISTFGAVQSRITIGHHDWSRDTEWISGAVRPIYGVDSVSEKDLTIILNIKGTSREDIITKRSNLLAAMIGELDIALDGYSHLFHVRLKSHKETEVVKYRWHQLELNLLGYEYGESVTAQTTNASTTPLTITNPGNIVSPCIVVITPRVGASSITLTGLCRDSFTGEDLPVTIEELTTGNAVTIDALTGLITEGGELKDMDIWALPSLRPGSNEIYCSGSGMTVSVTVIPFYE